MHEVSLVQALFDEADRAIAPHAPAAVRLLQVRLGELAGVDPVLFRTAFEGCRAERGYGAAELQLVEQPADWRCGACGAGIAAGEELRCATCGGEARLVSGDALFLDRLELEVPDV